MTSPGDRHKPRVAIAGASGFVGTKIRTALSEHFQWLALTRSATISGSQTSDDHTSWRHCDLFSLPQVEQALSGADYGIYLVHSMLPSSRLVQGDFADMDLLLADNFARAARSAGLKHIIYLGGLIPEDQSHLSPHLQSRLEVEKVLRASGIPVTVLRAGLIVGPGGSSTRMLINLVHRLPFMILPRWTRSVTQSIDVRDVVRAFDIVLREENYQGKTYDLAGHPSMTYKNMILSTGRVMNKHPRAITYPFHSIKLSRAWVRFISGVPAQLVNPLLESLTHDLSAADNPLLARMLPDCIEFETSVRSAMTAEGALVENPRASTQKIDRSLLRAAKRVRSIQRLPLPKGWDAPTVANAYGSWLTKKFRGLIYVDRSSDGELIFWLRYPALKLLVLSPTPFSRKGGRRRAFYISGGVLAQQVDPPGRLEFRLIPELNCLVAAIHGFSPSLPWALYSQTQARVHLWVMRSFAKYLAKV